MTRARLVAETTSAELSEWIAFYRFEAQRREDTPAPQQPLMGGLG